MVGWVFPKQNQSYVSTDHVPVTFQTDFTKFHNQSSTSTETTQSSWSIRWLNKNQLKKTKITTLPLKIPRSTHEVNQVVH